VHLQAFACFEPEIMNSVTGQLMTSFTRRPLHGGIATQAEYTDEVHPAISFDVSPKAFGFAVT
jgi:hypothetical protein